MPLKREIVYPFFLECLPHCTDIFWENTFEDLAYGRPPYGTYISKDFLCCSFRDKEFSYKIERKKTALLYQEVYNLFTHKVGILSQKEKTRKKLDFQEIEKNIVESMSEWSSIRKKNIKDVLIEKYVIDMKNIHNLSVKQCKYLLSVIMLCIIFKTINSKDIVYKDDHIVSIEGISFENNDVVLSRPLCSEVIVIPDVSPVVTEKLMSENWERFLKKLKTSKANTFREF